MKFENSSKLNGGGVDDERAALLLRPRVINAGSPERQLSKTKLSNFNGDSIKRTGEPVQLVAGAVSGALQRDSFKEVSRDSLMDGNNHSSYNSIKMTKQDDEGWQRHLNIRTLGVLLFVVASCYCLYKIADLSKNGEGEKHGSHLYYYETKLKLVNAFCRHGDRSPSEDLPLGDRHAQDLRLFWPNGMSNLTDSGRMREYRLGHSMRQRYASSEHQQPHQTSGFARSNSSQVLAFSSSVYRCIESTSAALRGFFGLEQSRSAGLKLMEEYTNSQRVCPMTAASATNQTTAITPSATNNNTNNCSSRHSFDEQLADGSGSSAEWEKISIDLDGVPTLDWQYLDNCKWRKSAQGRSPIDSDLLLSGAVRNLTGIMQLKELLEKNYNLTFVYDTIYHWSTILTELRLERTRETLNYTDHFAHWINTPVRLDEPTRHELMKKFRFSEASSLDKRLPTMFDVYEMLSLYVSRDRIPEGTTSQIQLGPMLSSLVDSQQVALRGQQEEGSKSKNGSFLSSSSSSSNELVDEKLAARYRGKQVIFYFTHDTILELLMFRTLLIWEEPASYIERFIKHHKHNMRRQFVAGLRMAEFGASLVYELYEMKQVAKNATNNNNSTLKSFAFVQAALYYEEDAIMGPVEFEHLELGTACRRLFQTRYPAVSSAELERLFYDAQFVRQKQFNAKLSCPFELFRNVTMQEYAMSREQLESLCLPSH